MSYQKKFKVIIAGGGTAGHVHAGIAIAKELENNNISVSFIGTKRGQESNIVPKYNYKIDFIHARGLKRESLPVLFLSILFIPIAILETIVIFIKRRPNVVIGVGGYASWAPVFFARFLPIKTYALEQNKVLGFTNKVLLPFLSKLFVSFPKTEGVPKNYKNKLVLSGCPIIKKNTKIPKDTNFSILVFGGSQGAYALNKKIIESIDILNNLNTELSISIYHQTGAYSYEMVKSGVSRAEFEYKVYKYIEDMPSFYSKVSLVICRSGASSVFELIYYKKYAILVPLPTATDNHQEKNARFLEKEGVATVLLQKDFNPEVLLNTIKYYIHKSYNIDDFNNLNYLVNESSKRILEEISA